MDCIYVAEPFSLCCKLEPSVIGKAGVVEYRDLEMDGVESFESVDLLLRRERDADICDSWRSLPSIDISEESTSWLSVKLYRSWVRQRDDDLDRLTERSETAGYLCVWSMVAAEIA